MEAGGVRGARGMLINITGSRQLGLHEVNEACTLVREATENDDVQINFGVVLDEDMGDEVKVTVIATGFMRDSLPRFERRASRAEAVAAAARPVIAETVVDEEPEPVEVATPEAVIEEPAPAVIAAAAAANGSPEPLFDDLEVPAILRARRRTLLH
jgi:cell division protein FtsZ